MEGGSKTPSLAPPLGQLLFHLEDEDDDDDDVLAGAEPPALRRNQQPRLTTPPLRQASDLLLRGLTDQSPEHSTRGNVASHDPVSID